MMDIEKLPYAKWLEETIRDLVEGNPQQICIAAIMPDRSVGTAYYECSAQDKAILAHNIQVDITMDVIEANIGEIKQMLDQTEEGD